jgi:class 3 adenylate cyclase
MAGRVKIRLRAAKKRKLHAPSGAAALLALTPVTGLRSGLREKMGSRRRRLDPVGPFGNPDGSRADLEDLISEFVDFGGDPAYGHLATRANDSMVRVIVGKLGAGKTVYLRRLQDFQAHQDSVYADVPEQSLPKTEVVVKACQWFSDSVLVEKWMQVWERAIMRSLASHLLRRPELRQQLRDEHAEEIEKSYARLLEDFRRPRSIYSQVRDIINQRQTAYQLSTYLDDPLWDDLEDLLGEVVGQCKPIYFYLDAVDEEFSHAPMYWLKCQEGLFYQVMRLLRDHRLGGRLHIVVCIRDIVMSSVYRSEHAPRYHNEPHIRVLTWNQSSLLYLLGQKLRRLPPSLLMRRQASGSPTIRDWLGINGSWPGGTIEDYLLSHTRLIPRDIISLGNELNEEVLRQKQAGHDGLPPAALQRVVERCAKRFGDSQLAQCANQISSDLMPRNAALHNYSELFTSTQAYISGVQEDVRSFVRMIGVDRFPRADLEALQEVADLHFEKATDLASVLWQNGLLGYVDEAGQRRFYSLGDVEEFHFPPDVDTYVLHPCLAHAVGGIQHVPPGSAGAGGTRRISQPTSAAVDVIPAGGAAMSGAPSGTVTLLFTDVEGSTRLWDAERDAMAAALRRHDEILREAIEQAGGYVFKTAGDSFCAAFSAARAGLDAALAAQRNLAAQSWPTSRPIVVRMALHAGVCEERNGDYFGPAVNRAARLLAVARGGQVLVSGAVAELLSDELPDGVGLRELGTHRLKDLSRPERIYQVEAAFLAARVTGLRAVGHTTPEASRHNC